MKMWVNPKITNLGLESTKDNCNTKDKHQHCGAGHSSSSCNCIEWKPIGPSFPIPSAS